MHIHIGHIIESIVDKKRLTQKEFGTLINKHEKTVPDIFKRSSISIDLLITICGALGVDLLSYYYEEEPLKSLREDELLKLKNEIQKLNDIIKQLDKELILKEKLIDSHEQFITMAKERIAEYKEKDKKDDKESKQ